ncbi:MAG: hypothetical protein JEZ07_17925 [Phycisphaerae bacterium]|nr:hypothetical protein [Phycisphaerae bacterium]
MFAIVYLILVALCFLSIVYHWYRIRFYIHKYHCQYWESLAGSGEYTKYWINDNEYWKFIFNDINLDDKRIIRMKYFVKLSVKLLFVLAVLPIFIIIVMFVWSLML